MWVELVGTIIFLIICGAIIAIALYILYSIIKMVIMFILGIPFIIAFFSPVILIVAPWVYEAVNFPPRAGLFYTTFPYPCPYFPLNILQGLSLIGYVILVIVLIATKDFSIALWFGVSTAILLFLSPLGLWEAGIVIFIAILLTWGLMEAEW